MLAATSIKKKRKAGEVKPKEQQRAQAKRQKRVPHRPIQELVDRGLVKLFKKKLDAVPCDLGGDIGLAMLEESMIMQELATLPFSQGLVNTPRGKQLEPRFTVLYAKNVPEGTTISYTYSGKKMIAHAPTTVVSALFAAVEKQTEEEFDIVLLNWYKHGQNSVSWHADDEKELSGKCIASWSLGHDRDFVLREKLDHSKHWSLPLGNGALICMTNSCQSELEHCVPKRKASAVRDRFNLTFRQLKK